MKYISNIGKCLLALLIITGCQEEDQEFGDITAPSNLVLNITIQGQDENNPNGDGSGIVQFSARADNALGFRYEFGDGSDSEPAPNGDAEHRYTIQGTETYSVTVIATGTGGATSTRSEVIDVFSAFDDVELRALLTGAPLTQNSAGEDVIDIDAAVSKTWYFATDQEASYGVGPSLDFDIEINGQPSQYFFPAFFPAPPNFPCETETQDCLCDDQLTFTLSPDNSLTFTLDNMGSTLFNEGHQAVVGGDGSQADCFEFDTSGVKNVSLAPGTVDWSLIPDPNFETPRGTQFTLSDGGFMGYFVSANTFEIVSVTEDTLQVRCIDGLNPILAWYFNFTTTPPND